MLSGNQEFAHTPLHQLVIAIGGHYRFIKETRLDIEGRPLLYRVAYAAVDSSCCGLAGLAYALVAGFIVREHIRRNSTGDLISVVETIAAPRLQETVRQRIIAREAVSQVIFQL